jgi:hypothetical protein
MRYIRFDARLALVLGSTLAGYAGAQSFELSPALARGNLHHGMAELSPDGRWVVFAGRYSHGGPGINSLYGVPADGSSAPFHLYDHGDVPGVDEFDPGTVTFAHVTPNSRWAVFTVDERGSIYSAYLGDERRLRPAPARPDPFVRLSIADTSRDFQITPAGAHAVFFGYAGLRAGLWSVPVNGSAPAVDLAAEEPPGARITAFAVDARSTRVVFALADEAGAPPRRLFSVPLDASEPPTLLSPHPVRAYAGTPPGGAPGDDLQGLAVSDFQLAPDGRTVLFLLEETRGDCAVGCVVVTNLFVVPTDGRADARRLARGDVRHAAFAPDSRQVVYRQAPAGGGPAALYAHPLDCAAVRLHEPADALAGLVVARAVRRDAEGTAPDLTTRHRLRAEDR